MTTPVYTDLATVKEEANLTTTVYDSLLNALISTASRGIDQATGRRFYPDTDTAGNPVSNITRYFWPQHPGYCLIDDLIQFTSLEAQGDTWPLSTAPGDGGSFILEPWNAPLDGEPWMAIRTIVRPFLYTLSQIPAGWAGFDGRIAVTGRWGWLTAPPEIGTATEILTRRLFSRVRDAPLGVVSLGVEAEAVRIARTDPDIGALIGPYSIVEAF